ncbi:Hypothetical protein D9617_18g032620 [Elsinoe fawcettii]|nr:Hypothetical protein D9617_18g032620 [Elsinoe fawcettii]
MTDSPPYMSNAKIREERVRQRLLASRQARAVTSAPQRPARPMALLFSDSMFSEGYGVPVIEEDDVADNAPLPPPPSPHPLPVRRSLPSLEPQPSPVCVLPSMYRRPCNAVASPDHPGNATVESRTRRPGAWRPDKGAFAPEFVYDQGGSRRLGYPVYCRSEEHEQDQRSVRDDAEHSQGESKGSWTTVSSSSSEEQGPGPVEAGSIPDEHLEASDNHDRAWLHGHLSLSN